ncbi:MAG: radical SAM protein [Mycoplasmataceae bacterium]|jgi:pyruvate formate lyase activating enzyme|nr:radical SAM protein [Mycoplasmataceae bacterium]
MSKLLPYFKIESFGAVDGKGIRLVIFSQGCPYKCIYCHNPESQTMKYEKTISVKEILELYEKNKKYYKNGGITISGGEPLLHKEFCLAIAKECKSKKIDLAFDTSAATFIKSNLSFYKSLIKYKPYFLVDIKGLNKVDHKKITGVSNTNELDLIKFLELNKIKYTIRYVLLQNYTDGDKQLTMLKQFIKPLKYMDKIDFLPFHNYAKDKYVSLKKKYILKDYEAYSKTKLNKIIKQFN